MSRRHDPSRVHLDVWTTRLHGAVEDPDLLDITRRACRTHEKTIEGWDNFTDAMRAEYHHESLRRARAREVRGLALVQIQRLALDDKLPSLGASWAPSWDLLKPTVAGLELADAHGNGAMRLPPEYRAEGLAAARTLEASIWQDYLVGWTRGAEVVPGFPDQMRQSYREHRASWDWLLGRRRVVVACLCSRPKWWPEGEPWEHCHRFLVAGILATCGGIYRGELPEAPSPQLDLGLG